MDPITIYAVAFTYQNLKNPAEVQSLVVMVQGKGSWTEGMILDSAEAARKHQYKSEIKKGFTRISAVWTSATVG